LGDADADAVDGAAAVLFQVELAFEGVVDRLDELADGLEQWFARRGSWSQIAMSTCRSSTFGSARAQATGSPAGVQTRCSRRPQNQREWEQQKPYLAQPASSERLTVGRDRPHSTGLESTIRTGSVRRSVSAAGQRITCLISGNAARRRRL